VASGEGFEGGRVAVRCPPGQQRIRNEVQLVLRRG
jgi:hypothetical protein